MSNIMINQRELSALIGLPHLQQLIYLRGMRPYVDYQTGIVGLKRGISYQSLAEELYIEPHSGIKSGSPSKDQIRRALKGLERAKIIAIHSMEWKLVIHCLLVVGDYSAPNKLATMPPAYAATNPPANASSSTRVEAPSVSKPALSAEAQAAIPLKSLNNTMYLYEQFEQFWSLYPKKNAKPKAWQAFQLLQPSPTLFSQMLTALTHQIANHDTHQRLGQWVPTWKFPANWLAQHGWDDELSTINVQEKKNAINTRDTATHQPIDLFWESCKSGAHTSDTDSDTDETTTSSTGGY